MMMVEITKKGHFKLRAVSNNVYKLREESSMYNSPCDNIIKK